MAELSGDETTPLSREELARLAEQVAQAQSATRDHLKQKALQRMSGEVDAELSQLVLAWDSLSHDVQLAVRTLVERSQNFPDDGLADLISRWPALPTAVRHAILSLLP